MVEKPKPTDAQKFAEVVLNPLEVSRHTPPTEKQPVAISKPFAAVVVAPVRLRAVACTPPANVDVDVFVTTRFVTVVVPAESVDENAPVPCTRKFPVVVAPPLIVSPPVCVPSPTVLDAIDSNPALNILSPAKVFVLYVVGTSTMTACSG